MKKVQEQPVKADTQKPGNVSIGAENIDWVASLNRRFNASKAYWDKEYKLDARSKRNEELYLGKKSLTDAEEGQAASLDNRIFSSVRTIVPYVTSRITEPEIYPSSNSASARKFAEDFEKAVYVHAKNQQVRNKMRFALEDAIIRARGYLKPRYDAQTQTFCAIEYVPAESIIIDHNSRFLEEPRGFRHVLEKTVQDLLTMFPEQAPAIRTEFGLTENPTSEQLEKTVDNVNEDWVFVPDEKEGLDLIVTWSYKTLHLGKEQDPNWRYGKTNFLDKHTLPLVFINVLNDGRKYIDKTTFVEQASLLQKNVDERGNQITKNASLGNIGMPVVDAEALADDQAQYLAFDEDTVLELDVPDGKSIRDVFDIWKAGSLPSSVYEDKIDSRNSIDNTFGTPNVFRGEQSANNTLGQDVLVRDQAFGRQQEIIDAIDVAMERLYPLIAQFLLVYGDEQEMFKFVGENGQFDYVLINSEDLDPNILIQVKSGTSMPIDRAQRRSVADKASGSAMIDPLTYWEIMDEGNAEKYAKRLMQYTTDPTGFMKETQETIFNRDAYVDIEFIKHSQEPPFREDLPKEYFDHLNQYVLSGDLDNPTIEPQVKDMISQFIDTQLARGQKMLGMAETQMPTTDEVNAANQQTDQLNQQDLATADAQAKLQAQGAIPAPAAEAAPIPV